MNAQDAPTFAPTPDRGLLPAGLRTLIRLRRKATIRRMIWGSGKRRIMAVVGICMIGLWILPQLTMGRKPTAAPEEVRLWLPVGMVVFIVMRVLVRTQRDPMSFQAAELDLVVPGPFSRRQLLMYQIARELGPLALMGLWMAIFMRLGGTYLTSAIGMMLLAQCINLLAAILGSFSGLLWTRARWAIWLLLLALLSAGAAAILAAPQPPWEGAPPEWLAWAKAVRGTPVVEAMCLPVRPYLEILLATTLLDAVPWVGAGLLLNVALIAAFIGLDRGEMEALVADSQKRLQQAEAAKRGAASVGDARQAAGRRVPMPPWLWGAGPVAWRQLVVAYRARGWVALVVIALLCVAGAYVGGRMIPEESVIAIMAFGAGFLGLMLPSMVRCDFRSDLEHMPMLKSLPLSPWAIVIGQLAAPMLIVAGVTLLLFTGLCAATVRPDHLLWGLAIGAICIPGGVIFLAIENIVFLLAPIQQFKSTMQQGFDPSQMARLWLVTIAKMAIFAIVAGLVVGPVALARLADAPWIVALLPGLAMLLGAMVGLLALCRWAFVGFNVSEDQAV